MRIKIKTAINKLSAVRGIGSYQQMLKEAITQYGKQLNLKLVSDNPDVELLLDFNPFKKIEYDKFQKQIIVVHDLIPIKYPAHFPVGLKGKICWWQNQRLLKKIRGIITDSKTVKAELLKLLRIESAKIAVVYPAAKKIFEQAKKASEPDFASSLPKEFVFYSGDITWNKNLVRLAKAIKKLNKPLVLAGAALTNHHYLNHPWQQDFRLFLNEVDKDSRFIFLGYVSDEALLWLYQHARAVALPSLAEGFGLTWLEASWQKTPVVVGRSQLTEEIMGSNSFYTDPKNVVDIAASLSQAWSAKPSIAFQIQAKRYTQHHFITDLRTALFNLNNNE